jgi:hypothetical protein
MMKGVPPNCKECVRCENPEMSHSSVRAPYVPPGSASAAKGDSRKYVVQYVVEDG